MKKPEVYVFEGDGSFPNSPLPVVVYRGVVDADTEAVTKTFAANGWSNSWVNGIYSYHHFHSIVHEVLGVASGDVDVLLGGPKGRAVTLGTGDVIVIPAGVAHLNLRQSADLLIVGAYPGGMMWDMKNGDPEEYEAVVKNVAAVSSHVPDPVNGGDGALRAVWP